MLNRREFLAVTGVSAVGAALASVPRFSSVAALPLAKPDLTLRIAPVSVEIAPGIVIKTVGYNGKVPGPILRFREGKRVTVDVHNDTDMPELVHWHGQFVASDVDGSDGRRNAGRPRARQPPVHVLCRGRSGRAGITRTCRPREISIWARSTANSDSSTWNRRASREITIRKFFLAAHQWGPSLAHLGPPNNGWEIAYKNGIVQ